ncbi:S8 family serine peptidase [Actinocorallia libanotica]
MLAAGLALSLVAGADPALALPKPRADQWWLATMGVQEAWKRSTGRGVTIALIDSLPNLRLPEFKGADLRRGRSFYLKKHNLPMTNQIKSHGTGMLAAMTARGGGSGYVGVAPDVSVLVIPYSFTSNERAPIRYAVDQGADIISMSFAGLGIVLNEPRCEVGLQEAINYAAERDVVLVTSAGNNDSGRNMEVHPAMCPGVLTVAGLARNLKPRKNAIKQNYVAVAAPSEDLVKLPYSGVPYRGDGGTSTAAAFTSAALALIRSAHPTESARQIVSRLLYTAQDVHTEGRDDVTGYGLIRPDKALTTDVPPGFANTVYDRLDAFNKKEAAWKDARDNPPPFTVGGDPEDRKEITSDWERYGPWLLGGLLLTLATAVSGLFLLRRKRRPQQ